MEYSSTPRRSRWGSTQPDLYSTVVIHNDDDDEDQESKQQFRNKNKYSGDDDGEDEEGDIYATMLRKDDLEDADDEDDSSLPPLLKRLPKDFGAAVDDDNDDVDANISGTMVVRTHRNNPRSSQLNSNRRQNDDEENNFSTFVVRSTVRSTERELVSGTMVRRTGGGDTGSTMSRAVASMQQVGELGFGKQRRAGGSSSSQGEEFRQQRKVSSTSIPECVTKEDPTTKYELLNELGKGSYGAVYKARDIKTSELVAIKVISLCEGEEGYEEIRGEIEMLQQCSHPNVVRYLGSYQGEEYLWIVMEYCGGGSVADLMNTTEEPLEEYQIAYICREALKGLSYLHSIFKVHRDIKGGNILLTEQGEVKLGDFGVAAQLTRTMSKRNTFIGTPHWMAPEVIQESRYDGKFLGLIQESRYDGKVDVWALGVSAIEMAEVLFMISIEPAPMLEDKEKWSLVFHDFVAKCLTKDPRLRPTASEMLKHKLIEKCKCGASAMFPKIEKARQIRVSMALEAQALARRDDPQEGPKLNEDYGDTVPSKSQNVVTDAMHRVISSGKQHISDGIEKAGEGDFGTFIVHDGVEMAFQAPSSTSKKSLEVVDHNEISSMGRAENKSIGMREDKGVGMPINKVVAAESLTGDQVTQVSSPSAVVSVEQTLKAAQQQVKADSNTSKSTQKNETVSRKSFAVQDKLWSIYAAGNTVPIPFLRATDISPIALLSCNDLGSRQHDDSGTVAVEAVQELFTGDGQSKKGRRGQNEVPLPPSVHQRLTSSSTLMNLAQALAYHKMCYEEMPLQELQAAQEQQTIQNLCDTLRTILRFLAMYVIAEY
ncbi:Protein kinase domain [Dillenia turbinata]|uniref:non-specific serine/threonine protein kinase n=1 Tax=Dillenia turbinata TaxID=194707 RepID=A0AAN8V1E9_9MAGN